MRQVQHLSPTSIGTWVRSPTEYYLQYLAEHRPERIPQTPQMSIGSAFDAYVKNCLHERLFGKGYDPRFDFENIFCSQVEPHNRDWARAHGKYAFDCYVTCGALLSLLQELQSAIGPPRFELEIKGVIDGYREGVTRNIGGVSFLGKPDLFYMNKFGTYVILDWKVNGWLSKYKKYPMKGYVRKRTTDGKLSKQHPDAVIGNHGGELINIGHYLESLDTDWARQLSIYSWLCGSEIGNEFIAGIDQLTAEDGAMDRFPKVEVSEHRLRVSSNQQWRFFAEAELLWEIVHSDHIFRDVDLESSQEKCRILESQAKALSGAANESDKWFAQVSRG